jgi:hypothetical protein
MISICFFAQRKIGVKQWVLLISSHLLLPFFEVLSYYSSVYHDSSSNRRFYNSISSTPFLFVDLDCVDLQETMAVMVLHPYDDHLHWQKEQHMNSLKMQIV